MGTHDQAIQIHTLTAIETSKKREREATQAHAQRDSQLDTRKRSHTPTRLYRIARLTQFTATSLTTRQSQCRGSYAHRKHTQCTVDVLAVCAPHVTPYSLFTVHAITTTWQCTTSLRTAAACTAQRTTHRVHRRQPRHTCGSRATLT
jgi:hypothetical protein